MQTGNNNDTSGNFVAAIQAQASALLVSILTNYGQSSQHNIAKQIGSSKWGMPQRKLDNSYESMINNIISMSTNMTTSMQPQQEPVHLMNLVNQMKNANNPNPPKPPMDFDTMVNAIGTALGRELDARGIPITK